jgi:hypothetical protein
MIDSTQQSGRDEQRDRWNDSAREISLDTTTVSDRVLGLGLPAYSWITSSVETSIRSASPGLAVADDR